MVDGGDTGRSNGRSRWWWCLVVLVVVDGSGDTGRSNGRSIWVVVMCGIRSYSILQYHSMA
jgi:hypothetical protein